MTDLPGSPMGIDRDRISLKQDYEVRYWSDKFGVTHDELKQAVDKVGHMASNVEEYFSSRPASAGINGSGLNE